MEGRGPPMLPGQAGQPHRASGTSGPHGHGTRSLKSALEGAERLLCSLRGCASWNEYLQQLQQGGGGSPCTFVWTAGTIAYRCRTCGVTPSSAVCVHCFKASDHEGHDYQMYISEAGGCCDCGDIVSWREQGCCPVHRPGQHGAAAELSPQEAVAARHALRWVLVRALLAAEDSPMASQGLEPRHMLESAAFREQQAQRRREIAASGPDWSLLPLAAPLRLLQWLARAAAVPPLRDILCEEILVALPFGQAPPGVHHAAPHATAGAAAGPAGGTAAGAAGIAPSTAWYEAEAQKLLRELAASVQQGLEVNERARISSLLSAWLSSLSAWSPAWDAQLIQEAVTFLILLLYSPPFKYGFGAVLVPFYGDMGTKPKSHPITKAMDRLTVQIFNSEEATLRLAQHAGLVECLLGEFSSMVEQATRGGVVMGDSPALKERRYLRAGSDLHMVLSHPSVALHVLQEAAPHPGLALGPAAAGGARQHRTNFGTLLRCFEVVQWASPYRRQLGHHVLYERASWVNVVQLEVHLNHFLKCGLLHPLLALPPQDPRVPATMQALEWGLERALRKAGEAGVAWEGGALTAAAAAAAHRRGREGGDGEGRHDPLQQLLVSVWEQLLLGDPADQVSAHLPLSRLAGSFLAALLYLATRQGASPALGSACQALQGRGILAGSAGSASLEEAGGGAGAARYDPLPVAALGSLRVLSWMSQIRHGLWVRNGDEVLRLEFFYNSHYWYEHAADMDLLILQAWAATAPHPDRVLEALLSAFGGGPFLQAVLRCESAASPAAAMADAAVSMRYEDGKQLHCFTDGLRLLVTLLRERWVWLPPSERSLLRRTLVHVLATGPRSHSALTEELTYELSHHADLDEVLEGIAQYSRPSEQQAGLYRLKPEAWAEFDPFYFHYSRRELQAALHEAQQQGVWPPRAQLAEPAPRLPFLLAGISRLLDSVLLYRVVWAVLRYCTLHCPDGVADDAALDALNLLALGLHHFGAITAGQAEGGGGGAAAAAGASAGALSPALLALLSEEGSEAFAPGILHMVKAIAAGSVQSGPQGKREYGWELTDCAQYLAGEIEAVLQREQAAAAAAAGQEPPEQLAGAAMTLEGASSEQQQLQQEQEQQQPGEGDSERQRKERAKLKREKMIAKMKAQQAQFASRQSPQAAAASPSPSPSPSAPSDMDSEEGLAAAETTGAATAAAAASRSPQQAQQAGEQAPGAGAALSPMDVDSQVEQEAGASCRAPEIAEGKRAAVEAAVLLPPHHPSSWREGVEGECGLCHAGAEAGPLGWVAHVQTSSLAMVAARQAGSTAGSTAGSAAGTPGGLFDSFPALHVLCCGHMLHQDCHLRYSASLRRHLAMGQGFEGRFLLDRTGDSEFLCPICRRIGNTLLPATHTSHDEAAPSTSAAAAAAATLPSSPAGAAAEAPGQALRQAAPAGQQAAGQQAAEPLTGFDALLAKLESTVGESSKWVPLPAAAAAGSSRAELEEEAEPHHGPALPAQPAAAALFGQHGKMVVAFERAAKRVAAAADQRQLQGSTWLQAGAARLAAAAAAGQGQGSGGPLWGLQAGPAASAGEAAGAGGGAAAEAGGSEAELAGVGAQQVQPLALMGGEDWEMDEEGDGGSVSNGSGEGGSEGEGEGAFLEEAEFEWEEALEEMVLGAEAGAAGIAGAAAMEEQQPEQQLGGGAEGGAAEPLLPPLDPPPLPPPQQQGGAAAPAAPPPPEQAQAAVLALVREMGAPGAQADQGVTGELLGSLVYNAVEDLLELGVQQAVAVAVGVEAARGAVEGGRDTVPPAPLALVAGAMIQAMQTAAARLGEDPHLPGGLLARALARELVRLAVQARAAEEGAGGGGAGGEEGEGEEGGLEAAEERLLMEGEWLSDSEGDLEEGGGGGGRNAAGQEAAAGTRLGAAPLPAVLWSLLGQGVAQWEVAHRQGQGQGQGHAQAVVAGADVGTSAAAAAAGTSGAAAAAAAAVLPPALVDQAHWRGLQSLAHLSLCCPCGTVSAGALGQGGAGGGAAAALRALRWLWGLSMEEDPPSACQPRCKRFVVRRLGAVPSSLPALLRADPFLSLLELLAALITPRQAPGGRGQWELHQDPAAVLQALLGLVYPLAVSRAAQEALPGYPGAGSLDGVAEQQEHELEAAVAAHVLPWLNRCRALLALLRGESAPAPQQAATVAAGHEEEAAQPQAAAALTEQGVILAANEALRALGLPGLLPTLRGPAADLAQQAQQASAPPAAPAEQQQQQPEAPQQPSSEAAPAGSTASGGTAAAAATGRAPGPAQLLQLPLQYQDWYLTLSEQRCSVCGEEPREPALCLLCGSLVCCGSRKCVGPSSWGMCHTHAVCCGGGTGVFFLPKNTRTLVMRKGRATFAPSPYLDAHGEEDKYLKRGKPLRLSTARYTQLQQLWMGGAFDFDSAMLHSANRSSTPASMY